MNDKNSDKRKTRYTNARLYYEKLYIRMSKSEYEAITEYCERNNISKSCFMAGAVNYYIDHKKKV